MFIKAIKIKNYRLFPDGEYFEFSDFNVPDGSNEGTGLTVFVGENGTGKTSLLDALVLPVLSYKAEDFSVDDFHNPENKTEIEIYADGNFEFARTMPRGSKHKGKGFRFEAGVRSRGNRTYLSTPIVWDQKFIRADGETSPSDGSPDIRLNVNNPFSGNRFNENDYLYLDRNRLFQIRSGTYNPTRFDRLMGDFDFQYLDSTRKNPEDLAGEVFEKVKEHFENQFLIDAFEKFKEISGYEVSLDLIRNWAPFTNNAFFASKGNKNLQINLPALGSGYEMIFSLIYSFFLAKQSGKQLIALIDEPELHLHPELQDKLVGFLLSISKEAQIILTAQSPLLIKQIMNNQQVKVNILHRLNGQKPEVVKPEEKALPYVSVNEVNFIAFGLPTAEYHNELYGHLQEKSQNYLERDIENYFASKRVSQNKSWIREIAGQPQPPLNVTLQTYIRNSIHHPENTRNTTYTSEELKSSIIEMVALIKAIS